MNKKNLNMLLVAVALLSITSTLLFYSFYKIKSIEYIPMDVKVGDHVGMNADQDALHFGTVTRKGCSERDIEVRHSYDYPVKVVISITGDLSRWTFIEENDFTLNKDEEKRVTFNVCDPGDTAKNREYTGTARITLKRV